MIFIFCLPLGCKKTLLKTDYTQQNNVKQHIAALKDEDSWVRRNAAKSLGKDVLTVEEELKSGQEFLQENQYRSGFSHLQKAYTYSNMLLNGEELLKNTKTVETSKDEEIWTDFNIFLMILLCITIFGILVKKRYNK